MKKPIFAVIAFLLLAVTLIPVYAGITGRTWLGTSASGYDIYYNRDVNAYRTGTTAILAVTVRNTEGTTINLTKVEVTFDWGETYESVQVNTTNKITMRNNEIRVFFIEFIVPDVSVASNLYTHAYTIMANFTGGSPPYTWFGDDFAVYSTDQADAINLAMIIDDFPTTSWQSSKARILYNKANNETSTAMRYYDEGDFAAAKQRFNAALTYLNQAWDAEEAYLSIWEDFEISEIEARIRSMDAMTSFFNGLSTMWVLFGIGWVLLGIGYIVKYLRAKRPEAPIA